MTVSNIIGPVLQYFDRFLIGALLTMSVVAYYTAPFDVISRLWIIPGSLVMTIFPAFSTLGIARIDELRFYFVRATKYMFLIIGIIALVLILFAHEILKAWLGNTFAENSTLVFQILSFGVLVSSLTHLTLALFQGIDKPNITANIQLLLLPVSGLLSFILIKEIGIVGAALAWTFSRTIGMLLSWEIACKVTHIDRHFLLKNRIFLEFLWFLAFASLILPLLLFRNIFVKSFSALFVCCAFMILGWRYVLDAQDRVMMIGFFDRILGRKQVAGCVSNEIVPKKL